MPTRRFEVEADASLFKHSDSLNEACAYCKRDEVNPRGTVKIEGVTLKVQTDETVLLISGLPGIRCLRKDCNRVRPETDNAITALESVYRSMSVVANPDLLKKITDELFKFRFIGSMVKYPEKYEDGWNPIEKDSGYYH